MIARQGVLFPKDDRRFVAADPRSLRSISKIIWNDRMINAEVIDYMGIGSEIIPLQHV